MSRADVQRLIDALPRGLSETPEARRWLWGLLSPVSIVRQYLDQRIDRIEWLLDPDLVPDEQILFLAALFGLADTPAVYGATPDELRTWLPEVRELWARKGTLDGLQAVVRFVVGARSLWLRWVDTYTTDGASGARVLLPRVGTAPGGAYDHPEGVLQLYVADPAQELDLDALDGWISTMLAANTTCYRLACAFVDDLIALPALWDEQSPGGSDGYQDDPVEGVRALVCTDGNAFVSASTIDGVDELHGATGKSVRAEIAVDDTGAGIVMYAEGPDLDDGYRITVDPTSFEISVDKYTGGSGSSLGSIDLGTLGFEIVADTRYEIRVDTEIRSTGTMEISVVWEGTPVLLVTDATPYTSGFDGVFAGAGARVIAYLFLVYLRGSAPVTLRGV